jgi:hypothetical protein
MLISRGEGAFLPFCGRGSLFVNIRLYHWRFAFRRTKMAPVSRRPIGLPRR